MEIYDAVKLWGIQKTAEMVTILRDGGSRHLLNEFTNDIIVDEDGNVQLTISAPEGAYYASEGREPGRMPPIGPIKRWAAERGIEDKAIYPIRLHIAKFGTKESGLHFLEVLKDDDDLISLVSQAFLEETKTEITHIFETYIK